MFRSHCTIGNGDNLRCMLFYSNILNFRMNGKRGTFHITDIFLVGEGICVFLRSASSIYSYFLCVIMVNIAWNVGPRMLNAHSLYITVYYILLSRFEHSKVIRHSYSKWMQVYCTYTYDGAWCVLNARHVDYCIPNATCIELRFFFRKRNQFKIQNNNTKWPFVADTWCSKTWWYYQKDCTTDNRPHVFDLIQNVLEYFRTLHAIVCSISIAYRISEFVSNFGIFVLWSVHEMQCIGMVNRSTPANQQSIGFTNSLRDYIQIW